MENENERSAGTLLFYSLRFLEKKFKVLVPAEPVTQGVLQELSLKRNKGSLENASDSSFSCTRMS